MSTALLLQALAPYSHCFPITPDAGNDLAVPTRAIRAGEAGTLVVDMKGGEEGVTVSFTANETRHLAVTRVVSSIGIIHIEGLA